VPGTKVLASWDMFMALVLIWSCIVTPVQVALFDEIKAGWTTVNYLVDFLFLVDICVIFNTAFLDADMEVVTDRGLIAWNYLTSWLAVDLVAILPFELMVSANGEAANLVRLARIGRLYKVLRLIKLVRLLKVRKGKQFDFFDWLFDALDFSQTTSFFI